MRTKTKEAESKPVEAIAVAEAPTTNVRSVSHLEQDNLAYSERRRAWYRAVARKREEKAEELAVLD